MQTRVHDDIERTLRDLYLTDPRPWFVGFSGGKDSTMVADLVVRAVESIPQELRAKPVAMICTDTRVEIPAVLELVDSTLARIRSHSERNALRVETHLLRAPYSESFWVNVLGRGYPAPHRAFRWCTQRLKIDPAVRFIEGRLGHWGEAIIVLGARRAESATRARTMSNHRTRNGLSRHPDLPRVWVSNPIEHLTTQAVWEYLLAQTPPWGGDNRDLFWLYESASGSECPMQLDTNGPSCGNSRFGCWTCTVVKRDKATEGLIESGMVSMQGLLEFREKLIAHSDPANGMRESHRMNGDQGPGPLTIGARRLLLESLLLLQQQLGMILVSDEELRLIQTHWSTARQPDDGTGVLRVLNRTRGMCMDNPKSTEMIVGLQGEICACKGARADTLRRMLATVEKYLDSARAHGLPDELLRILNDDLLESAGDEEGNAECQTSS